MFDKLKEFRQEFKERFNAEVRVDLNVHDLKKKEAFSIGDELARELECKADKSTSHSSVWIRSPKINATLFYDNIPEFKVKYVADGQEVKEVIPQTDLEDKQQEIVDNEWTLLSVMPYKDKV
jgi:hypothetical protein